MATVRKFTFDTRFDDPDPSRPTLGQTLAGTHGDDAETFKEMPAPPTVRPAPAPPPPPKATPEPVPEPTPEPEPVEDQGPPLVYTEEDMEIAREEAYVAGHTAALDEATVVAEQEAAQALVKAAEELRGITASVAKTHEVYGDLAARVASEICRRLLPETGEDYAVTEISALVRSFLPNLIGQSRLIVRIHPSVRETVHRALTRAMEQAGFEGRLTVLADDTLAPSDCRIEWPDGGAERNTTRLWADIDALIERNIPLFKRSEALDTGEEEDPVPEEPADVWPEVDSSAYWTAPAASEPDTDEDPEPEPDPKREPEQDLGQHPDTRADMDTAMASEDAPDSHTTETVSDDTVPDDAATEDMTSDDVTSDDVGSDDAASGDTTNPAEEVGDGIRQSVDDDG